MKTPDSRPRFQSSNRHYHRYRGDNRGWDDWVDPAARLGSRKRLLWILAAVVLAGGGVALLFYFGLL